MYYIYTVLYSPDAFVKYNSNACNYYDTAMLE